MTSTTLTTTAETAALTVALDVPADRNPALAYLARLAPGSRRAMHGALAKVATMLVPGSEPATFPWPAIRYQHAAAVRAELAETSAPATANKVLSALRGVLLECFRLGHMSAEDHARAADVQGVRGHREPAGRALGSGEIAAMFRGLDHTTALGARDAAMLALGYGAGLRRAELVSLTTEAVNVETGAVVVMGKGNKQRTVFVTNGALEAVACWLSHRGSAPGPLFCRVLRGGHVKPAQPLTTQAVAVALQRIAETAGVAGFSAHDLRRTCVGDMLDAGVDIATVAGVAGHASVVTTARYDRRGERARRQAAEALHVPFRAA